MVAAAGVAGVLLFGLPDRKDAEGSSAWDDEGPVPTAVLPSSVACCS